MKHIYPSWVTIHRKPATELRFINNTYYLYAVTSKYDPTTKKGKKVTGKLLGKITEKEGFLQSQKKTLADRASKPIDISSICVKEFGFTQFLKIYGSIINDKLTKYFPKHHQLITYMAYCRLVHQSPIKNMGFHISKSMLSIDDDSSNYDKKFSAALKEIGQNRQATADYMKSFIVPNDYIMVDMTNMFSASENISYVKKGYNSDMVFDTQFNLMYIYSPKLQQPIFYKLFSGNVREVTSFKSCLQESGISDAVIIADKGFFSKANAEDLQKNGLRYLIPLRRDNKLINYDLFDITTNEYISYGKRYVWAHNYELENYKIFIFKDEKLRLQEQNDYLNRIESKLEGYSREGFNKKIKEFGTLSFASNIKELTNKDAYTNYKSRNSIEILFDGFKTILKADKTYMQNDDTLNGWMFINHIAIQWYYIIYAELQKNNLLEKYSVTDFIKQLYEIKKVKINNEWYLEPMVKATMKMLDKLKLYSVK